MRDAAADDDDQSRGSGRPDQDVVRTLTAVAFHRRAANANRHSASFLPPLLTITSIHVTDFLPRNRRQLFIRCCVLSDKLGYHSSTDYPRRTLGALLCFLVL